MKKGPQCLWILWFKGAFCKIVNCMKTFIESAFHETLKSQQFKAPLFSVCEYSHQCEREFVINTFKTVFAKLEKWIRSFVPPQSRPPPHHPTRERDGSVRATEHLCDFSLIVTTWPHLASLSTLNLCTRLNSWADPPNGSRTQCWGRQLHFHYFLCAVGDTGRMALTSCQSCYTVPPRGPFTALLLFL